MASKGGSGGKTYPKPSASRTRYWNNRQLEKNKVKNLITISYKP